MPLPKAHKNVPRNEVHNVVELMLMNPDVGNVDSVEQPNKKYTVTACPTGEKTKEDKGTGREDFRSKKTTHRSS